MTGPGGTACPSGAAAWSAEGGKIFSSADPAFGESDDQGAVPDIHKFVEPACMRGLYRKLEKLGHSFREWRYPRGVVFHHVPKCGGTSVGWALRRRYLWSQATILPAASFHTATAVVPHGDRMDIQGAASVFREQMLLYLLYSTVKCVSAHVRFSERACELFCDRYGFVTVLREPVERYLSHFRYGSLRSGHMSFDGPLEEFVETEQGASYGAIYCDYFASLPRGEDCRTSAAIERAKANLERFAAVGLLDDLTEFARRIESEFGFRPRFGRLNRGADKTGSGLRDVPESLRSRVRDLCAPDMEVYEHARRLVGSRR